MTGTASGSAHSGEPPDHWMTAPSTIAAAIVSAVASETLPTRSRCTTTRLGSPSRSTGRTGRERGRPNRLRVRRSVACIWSRSGGEAIRVIGPNADRRARFQDRNPVYRLRSGCIPVVEPRAQLPERPVDPSLHRSEPLSERRGHLRDGELGAEAQRDRLALLVAQG